MGLDFREAGGLCSESKWRPPHTLAWKVIPVTELQNTTEEQSGNKNSPEKGGHLTNLCPMIVLLLYN